VATPSSNIAIISGMIASIYSCGASDFIFSYSGATIVSATYYVNGATGSDTNSGSQSFPFKTLQKAADQAVINKANAIATTIYVMS
jgi:enamine deaminase RidA (YjgF/YER057c/UK114 family)